jgi:hypothetical protein
VLDLPHNSPDLQRRRGTRCEVEKLQDVGVPGSHKDFRAEIVFDTGQVELWPLIQFPDPALRRVTHEESTNTRLEIDGGLTISKYLKATLGQSCPRLHGELLRGSEATLGQLIRSFVTCKGNPPFLVCVETTLRMDLRYPDLRILLDALYLMRVDVAELGGPPVCFARFQQPLNIQD